MKYKSYTKEGNAWMVPGGPAKFERTCILWQLVKYAYYNIKIIGILAKGHGEH